MFVDILNSANMACNIINSKMQYYTTTIGLKILVYDFFPSINNMVQVPASPRNINVAKASYEYVNGYLNQTFQGISPIGLLNEADYEAQFRSYINQLQSVMPNFDVIHKPIKDMYTSYRLASMKDGVTGVVGIDIVLLIDSIPLFPFVPPEGVNVILDKESYIRSLNRTFVTVSFSQAAYNIMYDRYLVGMNYDIKQYGEPMLEQGLYTLLQQARSIQDLSSIVVNMVPHDITEAEIKEAVTGGGRDNPMLYQRFSMYLDNMRNMYGIRDNVALTLLVYHPYAAGKFQHKANKQVGIDLSETFITNYYTIDKIRHQDNTSDLSIGGYNPEYDIIRSL